jgi:hypothetical protein
MVVLKRELALIEGRRAGTIQDYVSCFPLRAGDWICHFYLLTATA